MGVLVPGSSHVGLVIRVCKITFKQFKSHIKCFRNFFVPMSAQKSLIPRDRHENLHLAPHHHEQKKFQHTFPQTNFQTSPSAPQKSYPMLRTPMTNTSRLLIKIKISPLQFFYLCGFCPAKILLSNGGGGGFQKNFTQTFVVATSGQTGFLVSKCSKSGESRK